MIMALAKGKEELKALIVKEKTKKPKKPAGVVNLGRRITRPVRRASELVTLSKEGDNQEGETREEDLSRGDLIMNLTIMRSSILLVTINTNSWRIV